VVRARSSGDLRRITRHFEGDYKEFDLASPNVPTLSPRLVKSAAPSAWLKASKKKEYVRLRRGVFFDSRSGSRTG
jgi:hypothetical protein